MDTLAHALWSYIIFRRQKRVKLAVLFGVLPDLLSWAIYLVYLVAIHGSFGRPVISEIPSWTWSLYGLTHSVFSVLLVFGLVYLIFRKLPIFMFAWPLHILIDVPTHTREFLPTPFLYPFSHYAFPGISWGSWWFMITNYTLIISCFIYIAYNKRKGGKGKQANEKSKAIKEKSSKRRTIKNNPRNKTKKI